MKFFSAAFASLALLAAPALGAPSALKEVQKYKGDVKPGSYIVRLKDGVSKESHVGTLAKTHGSEVNITHADWSSSFFNGFAGQFTPSALNALRADPDVEYIEEDGVMHTFATVTQTNAPWGLQRISQTPKLSSTDTGALTYTYKYNSIGGSGVDIYVVDTGIYTAHSQFGGRARWGATYGGYANADGNGHGTHVAGTASGSTYGVAKSASLIAVKVLGDDGSGYTSDIVSGLNWVLTQYKSTGRPTIATMSLGGGVSTTLDNAVASLTSGGVHVTVAAGNSNVDAANTSPARAPSAITVGASNIADARASFSNYGSVVDIFAPGQYIISAWIGSTTATNNISGTSMATPHVAGLVAYYISVYGNNTPANIASKIKALGVSGALTGIPSSTVNLLARNDQ